MADDINDKDFTRTESTESGTTIRYHYMDNLRAIAMLVGLFFHAAIAYSPMMHNFWPAADPDKSVALDYIAWFTHLFRMPLFFLIAGFFSILLIEKRGLATFLLGRTKRILVPFMVFLPLVLGSLLAIIYWALGAVENPPPFLQLIAANRGDPDAPQPPFTTTHLWFLYNLCFFYLLLAALWRMNLFHSNKVKSWFSAKFVVFILPLLMVPALFSQAAPNPAPERIYPELWSFGFYGIFFIIGGLFFNHKQLIEQLKSYGLWMLLFSIVAYSYFYDQLPRQLSFEDIDKITQGELSWHHLLIAVIEAYVSVYMTVCCLIAGQALLDKQNRMLRFISDSSYWVYILHLPVLFYIQGCVRTQGRHAFGD